ncbi:FliH/SctL family protein [Edaphobacter paludis]|uniref:Flagellar assembly protein FliH n=1 Tax=Edaphobacter paludis TaxID=3035702 RepID=A0AAU7D973_9BACT
MTSLSENAEDVGSYNPLPGMPDRWIKDARKSKNVSRLEFHTLDWLEKDAAQDVDTAAPLNAAEASIEERIAEMERQLKLQQQEALAEIEAAQRVARVESRQEWKEELEERVAMERARVARVCDEFGRERARYFSDVEGEVVKLALAIAARVLHREANLDPLFLTAAVRVVLEKVADQSTMQLRVPAEEVERWKEAMSADAESRLQFIGEERMSAGECVLETSVGRVELGVKAQLEEIEKGFFDLLQQRPA